MPPSNSQILLARQLHLARKAGRHYDFRLIIGERAYSFATRKEMPEPGSAIMLYEQPLHTKTYSLQDKIVIPPGSYGEGVTTLDFVRKAMVGPHATDDQFTLHIQNGDRYLFKRMNEEKYGRGSPWLMKNLGREGNIMNKYLDKIAKIINEIS